MGHFSSKEFTIQSLKMYYGGYSTENISAMKYKWNKALYSSNPQNPAKVVSIFTTIYQLA